MRNNNNKTVLLFSNVPFFISSIQINDDNTYSPSTIPALKCLFNIHKHGQLSFNNGVIEALVTMIQHPTLYDSCEILSLAILFLFMIIGMKPATFPQLMNVCGGNVSSILNLTIPLLGNCIYNDENEIESDGISATLIPFYKNIQSSDPDLKYNFASNILQFLQVVRSREERRTSGGDDGSSLSSLESMQALLVIMGRILLLDQESANIKQMKLHTIQLLIFTADGTNETLAIALHFELKLILPRLIDVLKQVLKFTDDNSSILINNDASSNNKINNTDLMSCLILLTKLATVCGSTRDILKEYIFPKERDDVWKAKLMNDMNTSTAGDDNSEEEKLRLKKKKDEERMHPIDAPDGTLRHKLISQITSFDSNIKRTSSEMLLALCNQNMEEFTVRVGYGNAAYMMHVKGAISMGGLPSDS